MTMINAEKLIDLLYEQRIEMESDMVELMKVPDLYSLEEQRYDEGYTNALLWASLTISKMIAEKE